MDTIRRDVNPLASNMDQEEKKERGGMKGAAVAGVGAVAAVGAAAGATAANVIYDKVNSDDAPENTEEGGEFLGNDQENIEGGFLSGLDDVNGENLEEEQEEREIIENEDEPNNPEEPTEPTEPTDERVNPEDDRNNVRDDRDNRNDRNNPRENRNDPRDDDDRDIREPREPRNTREPQDDDDRGNIDERTDEIIENDQISINYKEGEYSPLGWRTLTDQDGNEVEAMIFTDGNGGYVGLIEGVPGSGIYDVAVNPNNLNDKTNLSEDIAFTRGDLESMLDTDGGYIAPGKEDDRLFADNDDIDKDIIVTDNGEMVAQRDLPDNYDGNNPDIIADDDDIIEDDEIDGLDDDMAQIDDDIIADDDDIMDDGMAQVDDDDIIVEDDNIMDDGMAQVDDDIIVEDDNIMDDGMAQVDDDIITDDEDIINDDLAQVDEADMISDEELDEYLGEDQFADVNEEMVEVVDTNEDLMADNTYYVDESTEMEADIYDDSMDVDMV